MSYQLNLNEKRKKNVSLQLGGRVLLLVSVFFEECIVVSE